MDKLLKKRGYDKPPQGKGKKYCEYLDEKGKCSVHKERPLVCRAFGVVKSPALICSYHTKEQRSHTRAPNRMPMPMMEYIASHISHGKGVSNSVPAPPFKMDLRNILQCAQILFQLFQGGKITKQQLIKKLELLEEKLVKKGDTLQNYFKGISFESTND